MIKLVVAGPRDFADQELVSHTLTMIDTPDVFGFIDEIIEGGCSGVDAHARAWAAANDKDHRMFLAFWDKHGKAAGPIRNQEMAEYGDALLAFWDGKREHSGTLDMISKMAAQGKRVYIVGIKRGAPEGEAR